MTTPQPPQPGLTQRDTGLKHPLFPGWFLTKSEVRSIERRNRHRHTGRANRESSTGTRCDHCGTGFRATMPHQRYCRPKCQRMGAYERTKQNGQVAA